MSDSPVVAASFPTTIDAQAFVNMLAEEDIPAHLIDAEVATTLGYLGSAIGGVKVHVLPRDLPRATELLGELHGAQEWGAVFSDEAEWDCASCAAAVPAEHDVCWSCGAVREGSAAPGAPAFEPVPEEERTTGEAASRPMDRAALHEERAAQGALVHDRRSRATLLLYFFLGPLVLVYMAFVYLLDDASRTATGRRDDNGELRVAIWGFVVLLVVAAAFAAGLVRF